MRLHAVIEDGVVGDEGEGEVKEEDSEIWCKKGVSFDCCDVERWSESVQVRANKLRSCRGTESLDKRDPIESLAPKEAAICCAVGVAMTPAREE